MTEGRTPAQLYALLIGGTLLATGIIGFFYESSFSSDESVRDGVFGLFDVNGWHNLVHLASGLLGLAAYRASAAAARQYALGFGAVYLVVTIWGFVLGDGESILGILPINTEDNFLHLAISLAGLGAGAVSSDAEPTGAGRGTAARA